MNTHPSRNSLVSLAFCLIMRQLQFSLDEITYGKDCVHRYSLPGVACKNSDKWNGAVLEGV